MDFDFIPFKLNTDLSYYKKLIKYIGSDNGVELYKAGKALKEPVLSIPVSTVNLYFFEGSLITVYIHLEKNPESFELVRKSFEQSITRSGKALKLDFGNGYSWESATATLGLIRDMGKDKLYLYYSLKKFAVF